MGKEFTGNPFKYTESELCDRQVGKFVDARDQKWILKKATYTNEGVWNFFTALRDSLRALLTTADGYVYNEKAHSDAQVVMDKFLIKRSRGENVTPPKEVMSVSAAPKEKEGIAVLDAEIWAGKKTVSANEELRWVFDNVLAMGVQPADSPSMGAYGLLLRLRQSPEQLRDFDKTNWPKLLAKEDAEKGGKLEDDGSEIVKLIETLQAALAKEES